ncbi:MAG: alpha/beta hydrolase [Chitinispirillaceae bacterium]|nr:alpha/beta hydrolase [Chitinispirillaceae bacterium]
MSETGFITIDGVNLEYCRIGTSAADSPALLFLHEGLGCVSLWKDFPARLAERTGLGALVYSRAGYGRSDPVSLPRPVRFMHDEADVLEKLMSEMNIGEAVLVGHSDGASISLIYAGGTNCAKVKALLLEAPHVFTEPSGLASIAKITGAYRTTGLRNRLAKHHGANTDIAFRGWNDVWLDPSFKSWNIEEFLPAIIAPTLLIQGDDDEYGTLRQLEAIARQVKGPLETLCIPACGHSPHREHPDVTLEAMAAFIRRYVSA